VSKATRGDNTSPYYIKHPQALTDSYYPRPDLLPWGPADTTDHLPMLAPGTPTPEPVILGPLFRLIVDRCDDLGFPDHRTFDVCGRLVLPGVLSNSQRNDWRS
jgi:hypothetical protein